MRDFYDTLVLGASLAGLGYASTHPDTLILEPTEMLGQEFTASFRPIRGELPHTGGALEESLIRNGILSEKGVLDSLALSVGLYKFAKVEELSVLLLAQVVGITKVPDGFSVEFLTNTGMRTVRAARILDTRSGHGRRRFNVVCHNLPEDFEKRIQEQFPLGVQVVSGCREAEYYVCFAVPEKAQIYDARQMVNAGWKSAFANGEAKITMAAFDFDIVPEKCIEFVKPDWVQFTGAAFADPLEAFCTGARFSFGKEES